jgi:hypothetical protein
LIHVPLAVKICTSDAGANAMIAPLSTTDSDYDSISTVTTSTRVEAIEHTATAAAATTVNTTGTTITGRCGTTRPTTAAARTTHWSAWCCARGVTTYTTRSTTSSCRP